MSDWTRHSKKARTTARFKRNVSDVLRETWDITEGSEAEMQIKSKLIFVCPDCLVAVGPNWKNNKCPVCEREINMDDIGSLPVREFLGPPDDWEKRIREDFG